MGLKNTDLIEYLFEIIDIEKEEFTTNNIHDWISKYDSAKRYTEATGTKVEKQVNHIRQMETRKK